MIKRIEHYWKGLSAPRNQISAIPPQAYGDRFINFITGVTMTREEAQRRETQESHRPGDHIAVGSASAENLGRPIPGSSPIERDDPAVERTMRKAQKQTDKATNLAKGRIESEEEKPDRTLITAQDTRASMTLPAVKESGESGSSSEHHKRALSPPDEAEEEGSELNSSPVPVRSSIPGVRKVSPSTVATATDMDEDDTSLSSPQTHAAGFDHESEGGEPYSKVEEDIEDEVSAKPPRIKSDLIQPHSPLEDSMFASLDQRLGDPRPRS